MVNLHVDMYTGFGHGLQVWATLKQMCRYAIQHGCRWGCLVNGREQLCCSFDTIVPPQVSHLSASSKNVYVEMWVGMHHTTYVLLRICLQLYS